MIYELIEELDQAYEFAMSYIHEHPVVIIIFAFIFTMVLIMAVAGGKKPQETRQPPEPERPRRIIYEY